MQTGMRMVLVLVVCSVVAGAWAFTCPSAEHEWVHNVAPSTGNPFPIDVTSGDYNEDGLDDFVVALLTAGQAKVYLSTGTGFVVDESLSCADCYGVDATHSFGGTADADLVTVRRTPNLICLYDGLPGAGTFATSTSACLSVTGGNPAFAVVGDVDGDTHADIVFAGGSVGRVVGLFRGLGAYSFGPLIPVNSNPTLAIVTLADMDGDGDLDMFVHTPGEVLETVNAPAGTFVSYGGFTSASAGAEGRKRAAHGDFNDDGFDDVVYGANEYVDVHIILGQANLASPPLADARIDVPSSNSDIWAVFATDINGDGVLDVVVIQKSVYEAVTWFTLPPSLVPSSVHVAIDGFADAEDVVFGNFFNTGDPSAPDMVGVAGGSHTIDAVRNIYRGAFAGWCPTAGCYTFDCIVAALRRSAYSTVFIPDGVYTGCAPNHVFVGANAVVTAAALVDAPNSHLAVLSANVTIDCAGAGVLFSVSSANMVLHSVTVARAGATLNFPAGFPALRVLDGSISTTGVVFDSCSTAAVSAAAGIGVGGAVSVESGGMLEALQTNFTANTAHSYGGAVAVAEGGRASFSTVVFERNSAGSGGGALFASRPLALPFASPTLELSAVTLRANTAAWGGALLGLTAADTRPAVPSNVAHIDLLTAANVAPGWLNASRYVLGDLAAVVATDVVLEGNDAALGGGAAYLCRFPLAVSGTGKLVPPSPAASREDFGVCAWDVAASSGGHHYAASGAAAFAPGPAPASSVRLTPFVSASPGSLFTDAQTEPGGVGSGRGLFRSLAQRLVVSAADVGHVVSGRAMASVAVHGEDVFGGVVVSAGATFGVGGSSVAAGAGTLVFNTGPIAVTGALADGVATFSGVEVAVTAESAAGAAVLTVGLVRFEAAATATAAFHPQLTATLVGVIDLCPPGEGGADGDGRLVCTPCPAGQSSSVTSGAPCTPIPACPANAQRRVSDEELARNVSAPCLCLPGFWAHGGAVNVACATCPSGGVCAGGEAVPVALPDYYDLSEGGGESFVKCRRPGACGGGPHSTNCRGGTLGFTCATCAPGYYSHSRGGCVKCPSTAVALTVGFLAILCVAPVVVLVVTLLRADKVAVRRRSRVGPGTAPHTKAPSVALGQLASEESYSDDGEEQEEKVGRSTSGGLQRRSTRAGPHRLAQSAVLRREVSPVSQAASGSGRSMVLPASGATASSSTSNGELDTPPTAESGRDASDEVAAALSRARVERLGTVPHSLRAGIFFVQLVGILAVAEIQWPSPASETMQALNVVNLSVSIFGVSCTFASFGLQYVVAVLAPAVSLVSLGIAMVVLRAVCMVRRASLALFVKIALLGLTILYIPLARTALVFFDCTKLANGEWRLDADYSVRCLSGEWLAVLPIAIGAVVVYVIGIPLAMLVALGRARATRFTSLQTLAMYGFLYRHLRSRSYLADVFALVHRLAVVATSLFASTYVGFMLAAFQILFALHAFAYIHVAPLYVPRLNMVEAVLDTALLVVCTIGWLFVSDEAPSDAALLSLGVLLVVVVGAALVFVAHSTVVEIGLRRAVKSAGGQRDLRRERFWRVYANAERADWGSDGAVAATDALVDEISGAKAV